jgi:beta-N-acetylhexosaminidase
MVYRNQRFFFLLVTLWMSLSFRAYPLAQSDPALQILEAMTTAEKIGQLFLVTFNGDRVDPEGPIYELITEHHISGILISHEYDNINIAPDSLKNLQDLIQNLQGLNYSPSFLIGEENLDIGVPDRAYLPLFIGYEYEGGQQGNVSVLDGLSPLSSNMAIGATWEEELAYLSGEILGRELEALGINLLLGPALDVIEDPQTTGTADLGVRAFGGDPFWVSVMGESLISGIHKGSNNRIAVVASHFPGLGGSDRPIEEEVATIRKSLAELNQFDLAPFIAVTEIDEVSPGGLVQGLLTSHIRYQGFQGNIRATTRPISLDPQAFDLVMSLETFKEWRLNGGITVSDSLGSRAIRLFRDPTGLSFNAHLVARDAFLAGNDLLLLENFRDSGDPDEFTTIVNTIEFFSNKYTEDSIFAQRVDEAVLRIIQLKLDIFGNSITYPEILETQNNISDIATDQQFANRVAQSGATLISPEQDEIEDRLEGSPRLGERIVFLTDVRYVQQCSNCPNEPLIPVNALEDAVLRLYGPGAAGQVGGWNLSSYSLADLANYLGVRSSETVLIPFAPAEEVDEAVRNADWLVFNLMDSRASVYGADAIKVFLDQRPDLAREKTVIVFSYDVPYGLDATEISKIDVYYALFDSGQAFIDMAAKLLFQEQAAPGASPVSIPGIGYELYEVTTPDENQIIQLQLVNPADEDGATQEPPGFMIGDDVTFQTGIITDYNGNRVPDLTPVEFLVTTSVEGIAPVVIDAATTRGQATATITIERAGLLAITARSGSARISETLQLDAQEDIAAQAVVISPTLIPTVTSEPTITPLVPTTTPGAVDDEFGAIEGSFSSRLGALVLGLVAIFIASAFGYFTANRNAQLKEAKLRYTLFPAVTGLLTYNYLALGLPGSLSFTTGLGGAGVFAIVSVGSAVGLLLAYWWDRLSSLPHKSSENREDEKQTR